MGSVNNTSNSDGRKWKHIFDPSGWVPSQQRQSKIREINILLEHASFSNTRVDIASLNMLYLLVLLCCGSVANSCVPILGCFTVTGTMGTINNTSNSDCRKWKDIFDRKGLAKKHN